MNKLIRILLITVLMFAGLSLTAEGAVHVRGYFKPSSGRYVMPSYRTSPNKYKFDNYSTKGNYNPYSGKKGYMSPLKPFKW